LQLYRALQPAPAKLIEQYYCFGEPIGHPNPRISGIMLGHFFPLPGTFPPPACSDYGRDADKQKSVRH
jgi:hypothetical protein